MNDYIYPACMVQNCHEQSAGPQWLTVPMRNWTIGWAVCSDHYGLLDRGEKFAPKDDQWPSTKRWLLMGDDLDIKGYAQAVLV